VRPIKTIQLVDLQKWCKEYHQSTKYPSSIERRFGIGFYQIYQAMDWKTTNSSWESWVAGACHFIMVCEVMDLWLETGLLYDMTEWQQVLDDRGLLRALSLAQAQIIYCTNENNIQRKSRYKESILVDCMCSIIQTMVAKVPSDKRAEALYDATSIMTGVL